jgi:cysteine desulfurase/selenocysteine lyase
MGTQRLCRAVREGRRNCSRVVRHWSASALVELNLGLDEPGAQRKIAQMRAAPPPADAVAQFGDRRLFPALEARAYLNHAAISPVSQPVRAAAASILDDYARRGAGAFLDWIEQRRELKQRLARLIGARPEQIALISNTTRGVTDVALCLPWQAGDRVAVFRGEFPGNVTPWQRAAELYRLRVVFLNAADYLTDASQALGLLEQQLRRGLRLVAVSSVQFQTGLRMPLEKIGSLCRQHRAELFVDAIQSCGAVPVSVGDWQADYVTCGSHKFLMGLEGAGFLYVHPERVAALRPHVAGWLSHENAESFLLDGPGHLRYDRPIRAQADLFEGGTGNALGFAALGASLELILRLGVDAIYSHVNRYLDLLEPELVERGFRSLRSADAACRSCILSLDPPQGVSVVQLRRLLLEQGVACSIPDGRLRFAPHWPNHPDEIPLVLQAVDRSLRALR